MYDARNMGRTQQGRERHIRGATAREKNTKGEDTGVGCDHINTYVLFAEYPMGVISRNGTSIPTTAL